ncbi:MAG: hypothetical protein AB7V77_03755 [Candidatus Woesearchaeota archaeon]
MKSIFELNSGKNPKNNKIEVIFKHKIEQINTEIEYLKNELHTLNTIIKAQINNSEKSRIENDFIQKIEEKFNYLLKKLTEKIKKFEVEEDVEVESDFLKQKKTNDLELEETYLIPKFEKKYSIFESRKKDNIKSAILNIVNTREISTNDLKRIIIEDEKLCSKATFYRCLKEMTNENSLNVVLINEKSIVIKNIKNKIKNN